MRKILFIDRDGTLIKEPPGTFQVDSFDTLQLLPGLLTNLSKIVRESEYELVMASNQDGLGTEKYPRAIFDQIQKFLLNLFASEGIVFSAIHIDTSFPEENKPTRKPNIGMLLSYFKNDVNLAASYVIGDRMSDMKLAENLGTGSIFIRNYDKPEGKIDLIADSWEEIYHYLCRHDRKGTHTRKTKETQIEINLNLDGSGKSEINSGIGFFDHLLDQIARHGNLDLQLTCSGDLHIDEHHSIEDTGIALGEAFAKALGNKRGMERFGFLLPMDDCLAQVALDFGGRSELVWSAKFDREKIGEMPTEMFPHFFKSFCDGAKCNLNIKCEGTNEHHKIESIFKAFARCVKQAAKRDFNHPALPTTKGML